MKICGMTFVDLYLDDYLYGVIPEVLGGEKISSTYLTYAWSSINRKLHFPSYNCRNVVK